MSRWIIPCLLLATVVVLAAEPVPQIPRDTLPTLLSLTAIPDGLDPQRSVPADNPLTEAKVALGRKLFFDPILSADRTVACASCHDPAHAFADNRPRAVGVGAKVGRRNTPSLLNRAYGTSFFWDGRARTLEEQALGPIENPVELGSSVEEAVRRLRDDAEYRRQFESAFPDGVTATNLARAIASFERVLLSGNNRADRFVATEVSAMNASERHGMWIFQSRGQCWKCHSGPNLTDEKFHNTGVSWGKEPLDLGRYEATKVDEDRGKFKTPSLRDVALTPPYMHDGSLATLEDVVEFYNKGGGQNPHLDPVMQPLQLSRDDMKDLVAFLRALTGTGPMAGTPAKPSSETKTNGSLQP